MKSFTRYIKIVLSTLFISTLGISQVEVSHKGDWFYVEPGTDVHIKGGLTSLKDNTQPLSNLGNIYISDSVKCYGDNKIFGSLPDTVIANIYLNGKKKQIFAGNTNMRFGNLHIRNSYDSLEAWNNIEIYNYIKLDSGNVKLVTKTLDLLNTGKLIGETNEKRIFTDEYGEIHLGRPLISGNTYNDLAGIGLDLTINGNLGTNVDVYRRNHQQLNASNGSVDRYYYFNPAQNGYVSKPNIHYLDTNELHGNNEATLALYHSESSGATWLYKTSSVNTTTDKVLSNPAINFVLKPSTMLTLASQDCDTLPYIHFAQDTIPLCGGTSAYLHPLGISGLSNIWSTGATNKDSIQVSTPGTYKVTVTNLAGCPNTDSVVVINAPNPIVNYTVSPVCVGDTSKFKNLTTIASGSMSYFWELGDSYTPQPDTTSDSLASLIYTNQGTYATKLTVTSNYGCVKSLTKSATSLPYPVVNFAVSSVCEDTTLAIVNNTTVTPSAGILYRWDFGNGDTSIVTTPSYVYNTIGAKTIALTATSNGCTSTLSKNITINANPTANFIAPSVCKGDQTVFTNTTSIVSGTISNNYWTFMSGANSTLQTPTYTFLTAGTHPVNLKVTSAQGCVHDTTINVVVNALPVPVFTNSTACMGDSILFTNSSNPTSTFNWNFNNVGSSTQYSPKFSFATSGSKNITLTETDTNGCVSSVMQTIVSQPRPTANFTSITGCEDALLSFSNTSSTPSGIITYNWNFDNGNTSTIKSPNQTFVTANTYNVKLIAEVNGCKDTVVKPIVINPKPVVNLGGVITTCANQYILDAQNSGATYLWSNSSTNQSLTVNFNGQYWVNVTNSFGCIDSDTVQVVLNSVVKPNLGNDATFCDAKTLDAGYPGATYLWSNSATSKTINITTSGSYWVQVIDQNNCLGRDTIVATIVQSVLPTLGPDLAVCDGQLTVLNPVNTGASYVWNNAATTNTINVTNTGIYWVDLTDANGCVSRDSIAVVFNPNPVLNLGNNSNYCDSAVFNITQNNVTYLWDNGSTVPNRKITNSGQYWAELTDVTTGCTTTDTVTLTFSPRPIINLGNDSVLCSGTTLILDAQNAGAGNSFSWNVGTTNQTLPVSSSGTYISFVTSPQGCVGSDTIQLTVNAPITTYLGTDYVLCKNQTTQLTSPILGGNYQWYFNGSLLPNTTQSITTGNYGDYTINVTDAFGCFATDTITLIETGSNILAEFIASTVGVYEGDTIHFVNLSSPSPFTNYWDFGDGAFSIAEDPTHTYFAPGSYDVKLTVSNGICTSDTTKTLLVLPLLLPQAPKQAIDTTLNSFLNVNLYPNPNDGNYTLSVNLIEEGELHIECFSASGQQIFNTKEFGKEFNLYYNNNHLERGVYLIRLRVNEEYKIIRFIKTL